MSDAVQPKVKPLMSNFGYRRQAWLWGGTFGRWTLWPDRLQFRAIDPFWIWGGTVIHCRTSPA